MGGGVSWKGKEIAAPSNIIADYPPSMEQLIFFDKKTEEPRRIEVVGTPEFKELWGPVLYEAGAKVVNRLFMSQPYIHVCRSSRISLV
jgi:hypothetical protein